VFNRAHARSETVDLIISGGSIITMDATRRIIRDGALAIKLIESSASASAPTSELVSRGPHGRRQPFRRRPGFVNSTSTLHTASGDAPDTFDGNQWSTSSTAGGPSSRSRRDLGVLLVLIELN